MCSVSAFMFHVFLSHPVLHAAYIAFFLMSNSPWSIVHHIEYISRSGKTFDIIEKIRGEASNPPFVAVQSHELTRGYKLFRNAACALNAVYEAIAARRLSVIDRYVDACGGTAAMNPTPYEERVFRNAINTATHIRVTSHGFILYQEIPAYIRILATDIVARHANLFIYRIWADARLAKFATPRNMLIYAESINIGNHTIKPATYLEVLAATEAARRRNHLIVPGQAVLLRNHREQRVVITHPEHMDIIMNGLKPGWYLVVHWTTLPAAHPD